jgi:phenylpyruvate tautomerase PptA (4-oxalocrotonate tautomerase family)
MPKIELQYSHGALPAASLGPLTDELATLLLRHRGLPLDDETRAKVWAFAHEQPAFVAGAAPALPLVVATISQIEGGLDDAAAAALIAEGTVKIKAIAPEARVWLVIDELPRGRWGVEGRAF